MAMVRFEDVATRVNTREDRFNTALTYYVGGEHIETGELKVAGRGVIKEADLGPMFYFGFKPGDILFVTRNPHLRKCAMVDFPGICSEKTLVIATKNENILSQRYLAAVMQSDDFWEFMEENKSGSVNYFVNWSTLAEYEFDLPPIDRQRELADLLWAANDLKEAYKKAISATDEMLKAKFREMFGEVVNNSRGWPEQPIRAFAQVRIGPFGSVLHAEDYITGGHFIINPCHMGEKGFEPDMKQTVSDQKFIELSAYRLKAGDVVLGRRGDIGRCVLMEQDNVLCGTGSLFIRIFADVCDAHYLIRVFRDPQFKSRLEDLAIGTTMKNINAGIVENLLIPLPPPSLQQEFVAIAGAAEETKAALKRSLTDLEQVMKGLINQ